MYVEARFYVHNNINIEDITILYEYIQFIRV
jgi:hypothetical protein